MTSARDLSPKKPYQATVEDYDSDSDSTLTEPEPKQPPTVLKDASKPMYSNVRKPAKVRFSRQPSPIVIHPPTPEKDPHINSNHRQRQNSSRPIHRDQKPKGHELSAVDMKWGQLFDDQWKPTDRLRSVYRGIANFLLSEYHRETTVLYLSRLRLFFDRFPGGHGPNEPADVLDRTNHDITSFLASLKCDYHLVPATPGGIADEPALTARGFAELMQVFAQTNPELEATRLNEVMRELPIETRLHSNGQLERLPKQISRHLFPPKADVSLRRWVIEGTQRGVSPPRGVIQEYSPSSRLMPGFYGPPPGHWSYPYDPRYYQQLRSYQPYPSHDYPRHSFSHWQPAWDAPPRSNRFDNSKRYVPVVSSSSTPSSESDSCPPSPKSPSHRHRRDRTPSPPARRQRRNSSPPRHTHSSTRQRRHSDAVSTPRRSSGLWAGLSALALHPRHADERRRRSYETSPGGESRRRRSYEPSPGEETRRREYVNYNEGRERRGSTGESVLRSERGGEGTRRRSEGGREIFMTKR